jgi:branched-chain amino acid transport system permease protein
LLERPVKRKNYLAFSATVSVILLVFLPPVLPTYIVILLTQALIFCIVAMSLDLLIGYTALGALGHGTFFAIGAYVTAILTTRYGHGFGFTLIAGIGLAATVSALVGLFALRATGIYFLLISLSIAMCVWGLAYQWVSVTGGENGISGIQRPHLFIDMSVPLNWYYFVVAASAISFLLMFLLIRSPFGRTMVGIRDSALRMKVLGYNTWLHRYFAFIIAGAFAGGAGTLCAFYNSYVSPNDGDLGLCFKLVLMVTIGGPGTLIGPCIGAFIITFLENILSTLTDRYLLLIAFVYVLSAMYAPQGILGGVKSFLWKFGGDKIPATDQ